MNQEHPSNTENQPKEEASKAAENQAENTQNPEEVNLTKEEDKAEEQSTTENTAEKTPVASADEANKEGIEGALESDNGVSEKKNEAADHHQEQHHDDEHEDDLELDDLDMYDLFKLLKNVAVDYANPRVQYKIKTIVEQFYSIYEHEKREAFEKFMEEVGDADAFEYKKDLKLYNEFSEFTANIQRKIKDLQDEQEKQKDINLKVKEKLLEDLRELVDGEETDLSMAQFKEIQSQWRETGPVPPKFNKELWSNYHALVDRFYNNRRIFIDLIELDRKKNLESKLELVKKAEELAESDDIRSSIKKLNELHEEFKHIGPVPKENKEDVWQKFKAASDAVYVKKKALQEEEKKLFEERFEKKKETLANFQSFLEQKPDKPKEWNKKTKEVQDYKKLWESIGFVPKSKAKDINKEFWKTYKSFFAEKSAFFSKLDEEREGNYQEKVKLVEQAEAIKNSENPLSQLESVKQLQQNWKNIGPAPFKKNDEIYKRFKETCDAIFDMRRQVSKDQREEQNHNLKAKKELCRKLEEMSEQENTDKEKIEKLVGEWQKIGFVPLKEKDSIQTRFNKAIDKVSEKSDAINHEEKAEMLINAEFGDVEASDHSIKMIKRKESDVQKKIRGMEEEVQGIKTNLAFFNTSSNSGSSMLKQYEQQIKSKEKSIAKMKTQLSQIRTMKNDLIKKQKQETESSQEEKSE